jgi:hypothetical protein
MGLVLMLAYLAWVEIAFLLFMLFFATAGRVCFEPVADAEGTIGQL